jgi:hypothetical protein
MNGQSVWAPPAGSATPQSYNAGPAGQVYQAAPQVNGSLSGYAVPQQPGQFNPAVIPSQPATQPPMLVPMEPANQPSVAPAYGYGAQQPASVYPQPSTVPPGAGATYGSGSFIR